MTVFVTDGQQQVGMDLSIEPPSCPELGKPSSAAAADGSPCTPAGGAAPAPQGSASSPSQQQLPPAPSPKPQATLSSPRSSAPGPDGPSGLHRLKIVGIPAGYSEEQLRSLFQLCGNVAESRVVHDKQSGRPVGYGYVSFFTKEAADLAISTFDDQITLQGAANHLSVYYAKKQHDTTNDKESCPARNAKLYFCGTPSGLRRDSILALFSAFGRVRHLQVYTDSYGVLSSGTVTMYSTDEAIEAMNSLDGKVLQPGTAPLKVTWAQLSTLPRRNPAGGGPPPPMPRGFTVSYACIPTSVTPAEVASTFERFGTVLQVVPFAHRREGPLNSRGCGLVVMDREPAAMAAVEALSGVFTWPGAERPLLVQPFYERVSPDMSGGLPGGGGGAQAGQFGRGGGSSGGGGSGMPRGPTNHHSAASAGARGHTGRPGFQQQQQQQQWPGSTQGPRGPPTALGSAEAPPPGCSPDAFKLMLTNLPGSYTHTDVVSLLQPYGTVVSLTVLPAGGMGRDSTAGVWYASAAQAEAALAALSNTVLMATEGTRQLEVKAFKRPLGQYPGFNAMQRGMQQGQAPGLGGGGAWHSPHDTQGLTAMQQQQSPGMSAYQQASPVSHQQGLLQQGGYGSAGHILQQQQAAAAGLMGGETHGNSMWVPAGGASGGASPGHLGMQTGDPNSLSALSAAMSAGPNAYSMQQLLSMLPQQQAQQQHNMACVMLPGGGAGAWPGGMVMPNGAVSLSSTSNLDGTLQSYQGGTDPGSIINPSVSASLLAPAGPGAGYTGWLA